MGIMGWFTKLRARGPAGLEPFARGSSVARLACDGLFEILEASRKRPRFAHLSETPRALPPRWGSAHPEHPGKVGFPTIFGV